MNLLVICILFIIAIYVSKLLLDDWINPGVFILIIWFSFVLLSFLYYGLSYKWGYFPFLWVFISCFAYMIGAKTSDLLPSRRVDTNNTSFISSHTWGILILFIVLGVIRTIIETYMNGFSIKMFFDFNSLIEMNSYMAATRYAGMSLNSPLLQLLSIFVYSAPLCGGYSVNFAKNTREKFISLLTFLPIVTSLLLTNGKSGIIAATILWISGYFVGYVSKHRRSPQINLMVILKNSLPILLFLSLIVVSMLLRIGRFNMETLEVVIDKFALYAIGHMPTFDLWFDNHLNLFEYDLGSNTFTVVFKFLGLATREQGVYALIEGSNSNIFTAFRGIINDYGTVGGVMFMYMNGIVAGWSYRKVKSSRTIPVFASVILMASYFFIAYSFIVSPWIYSSYSLVLPVFGCFIYLSKSSFKITI